jgi:hydrogenase maturation protein HypF
MSHPFLLDTGNSFLNQKVSVNRSPSMLLAAVGRPVVLTSGNVSDEPIAYIDDDATSRLARIA